MKHETVGARRLLVLQRTLSGDDLPQERDRPPEKREEEKVWVAVVFGQQPLPRADLRPGSGGRPDGGFA